jgi:hypothetical protein
MHDKSKRLKGIAVDVYGVYKLNNDKGLYILDSFCNESSEGFPLVCEISEEIAQTAKSFIDKQLVILPVAIPQSEPEIYADEEEFKKMRSFSFASQSFLASSQTIATSNGETPAPQAMITGIVESCNHLGEFEDEDDPMDLCEVRIGLFGITITAVFRRTDVAGVVPGNILSCTYYLCGELEED